MNAKSPATPEESDASAFKNEELIKQLECLSGVLGDLRSRERSSELPSWLRQGLREADQAPDGGSDRCSLCNRRSAD